MIMNKIAVLGDIHLGARGDSSFFIKYFNNFFENVFFPVLKERKIKDVVIVGDIFDRRKFVNFNTLYEARKKIFDKFLENDISVHLVLGNHDIYYKNTLEVNSPNLLLDSYLNIHVYDTFRTLNFKGIEVDFIPWICDSNKELILDQIKNSKSRVAFGHFELNGFEMDKGNFFRGGEFDRNILDIYSKVYTGHFHHKSDNGKIYYVGSPYQLTWADYDDQKGFYIVDLETYNHEFIENPLTIYKKIIYNDSDTNNEIDFEEYSECFVKVIVETKNNLSLFDSIIESLYVSNAYDVGILELFELDNSSDNSVDQTEDTLSILLSYIDNQDLKVDNDKLKDIMRNIYNQSLNIDKVN